MVAMLLAVLMTSPSPVATRAATRVVEDFYAIVIKHHPLGLPTGQVKREMAPYLSPRLLASLAALEACERDYFGRYLRILERDQLKPDLDWLEYGLFSGGHEKALPAEVVVTGVKRVRDGRLRAEVELTYRETFETYGKPPDPKAVFKWQGAVMLVHEGDRFLIDDFIPIDDDTGDDQPALAREFEGCRAGKWVGRAP
jgi:hypothetical protein